MLMLHSQVLLQGTRAWVEPRTHRQDSEFLVPTQDRIASDQSRPSLSVWQIAFFALGGAAAYALVSGE